MSGTQAPTAVAPVAGSRKRSARNVVQPRAQHVGDALGGYRLCVELGSGGMATVYLAHARTRSGVHRFAAVKCIRPELALDETFVEMLHDEAFVATHIHHPNVCNVIELDRHHGTYYLAMELLFGQTVTALQQQLASFPQDRLGLDVRAGLFARILEGACEGLHAAHEAVDPRGTPLHVVHRDVSPDNLFITYDGNVKVMDFGVAYTSSHHHRTRTGVLKGKCCYVAPEVVAGHKPDRRADIWGVGVVAWELLTRCKLFDHGSDAAILHAIGSQPIPPPSSLCPGLPHQFDAVVLRALERDPANRFATAREFGRALNRCIVEQGWVVGAAEIADCMRGLFPDGIATARQQLKFAEQLEPPPTPRARAAAPRETTVASPEVMNALARETALPAGTPNKPITATEHRIPAHVSVRWLVAIVLVAIAGSAATVVACRNPSEPAPAPSGFSLQATPAGVDTSGAVLLRVQVVPR